MAVVTRLVTLADVDEDGSDAMRMAVSALHEAELDDGRRVLLLDDRGWVAVRLSPSAGEDGSIWSETSVADIEAKCRAVVGPDEPLHDESPEEWERSHWAFISRRLARHDVIAEPGEVKQLRHDVVLSDRLLERMGRRRGEARGSA